MVYHTINSSKRTITSHLSTHKLYDLYIYIWHSKYRSSRGRGRKCGGVESVVVNSWISNDNSMWWNLSVTCDRSVTFSGYCSFLHQQNWQPRYNGNIVESGVKYHTPLIYKQTLICCLYSYLIRNSCGFHKITINCL